MLSAENQNPFSEETNIGSTLKLVQNRTHLGPSSKSNGDKKSFLSAAANKIRINNDLKIEFGPSNPSKVQKVSGSKSLEIHLNRLDADSAIKMMIAWDLLFKGPGTPDYVAKANALSKARAEAYRDLGINPDPGSRVVLTMEQREFYNSKVSSFAFDYYEVCLSFKQPGFKVVRSKTFRFLNEPNLDDIQTRLVKKVDSFKFEASAGPKN